MPVHQFLTGFVSLNDSFGGSLRRALRNVGLALSVAAVVATGALAGAAKAEQPSNTIQVSALPVEAQQTERLIRSAGPFPYSKDGVVFGNRERHLPNKPRGWYREYTVKTPGARNRGARRIVCGGDTATTPQACYYSDDHYASFKRIVQ